MIDIDELRIGSEGQLWIWDSELGQVTIANSVDAHHVLNQYADLTDRFYLVAAARRSAAADACHNKSKRDWQFYNKQILTGVAKRWQDIK